MSPLWDLQPIGGKEGMMRWNSLEPRRGRDELILMAEAANTLQCAQLSLQEVASHMEALFIFINNISTCLHHLEYQRLAHQYSGIW